MLTVIGNVAAIVVAVVAATTAVTQIWKWIYQRGYNAGRSAAYLEAERAAQTQVAKEVQALRNLLDEKYGSENIDRLLGHNRNA